MSFEATRNLSGARQLVKAIEAKLESISDYSSPALDKIGGGCDSIPGDRVYRLFLQREHLTKRLTDMLEKCLDLEEASEAELDTVNDLGLRAIIIWRYVHNMNWVEIASKCGERTTADAVKKRFERSMKAYDEHGIAVPYSPKARKAVLWMEQMFVKAQITDRKERRKQQPLKRIGCDQEGEFHAEKGSVANREDRLADFTISRRSLWSRE
mgnify:CR=1 FL=1